MSDQIYKAQSFEIAKMAEHINKLEAENAKLRAERDEWHRVVVSKQDIIDHMRDAKAENDKLRELVREMHATISDRNSWWDCTYKDTRRFADHMREFGIEVGDA